MECNPWYEVVHDDSNGVFEFDFENIHEACRAAKEYVDRAKTSVHIRKIYYIKEIKNDI